MRLGKCNDLSTLTPSIIQVGGATGSWTVIDAAHGQYVTNHPAGGECGGGGDDLPYSLCTFLMAGCGRVKVTVSGYGDGYVGLPSVIVFLVESFGVVGSTLQLNGGTGGAPCSSADLSGDDGDNMTFSVACGWTLELAVDSATGLRSRSPAMDVTFTVEVLP